MVGRLEGRGRRVLGFLAVVAAFILGVGVGQARAASYAPVNTPGPPLSVPAQALANALSCHGTLAGSARPPVLLVPGTTLNPSEFAWNWEPALAAQNIPYCTIDLPGNGMADIPTAGEYVVYAIRTMYAEAGERIDIVGHSQGGMVPRWALRFWPDTRTMVDDLVGLSPSNHGTVDADAVCTVGCAPAFWQQEDTSPFYAALNSEQETFAGISYTDIYTDTDEVVVPNLGPDASSALHGGGGVITNVAIQQVCATDPTEHIGVGTYDNTAYQIAMDALTHPGPADPSRVSSSVCGDLLMPGVVPAGFAANLTQTLGVVATTLATYPHVASQPALPCYVTASCTGESAPALELSLPHMHVARTGTSVLHADVRVQEGGAQVPVPSATVTVNGASATTGVYGAARVRSPLKAGRSYVVTATLPGCNPVSASFVPARPRT